MCKSREARRSSDALFKHREIMQMTNDGGIILLAAAFANANAPGQSAQLIGRRFDRIDTKECGNLGFGALRLAYK